jgi:hypothetical protein
MQRHPFSLVQAEIARWIEAGDLKEDRRGDYKLTATGETKIAPRLEERVEPAS